MPIRVKCPNCQTVLSAKDHLAGKRVACVSCKKVLVVPAATVAAPAGPKAPPAAGPKLPPTATTKVPAPPPAAPPPDADALAASALADEMAIPTDTPVARPIVFDCEFCEAKVEAPAEMAGKRMQCTNPECRQLLKVPLPKEDKPKDWRALEKKGPSAALINQPEKIDEAAWGTQTDKGRVTNRALVDAGVVPEAAAKPVGADVWVRRALWAAGAAAVLAAVVLVGRKLHHDHVQSELVKKIRENLPRDPKQLPPLLAAEAHRGVGLLLIRDTRLDKRAPKARYEFQQARGWVPPAGKGPSVDRDLFLVDLALAQAELGGSEYEATGQEKLPWKSEELRKDLEQTLNQIQAPEARAIALRELATRLHEKEQPLLALALVNMQRTAAGQAPALVSQQVALLAASDAERDRQMAAREAKPPTDLKAGVEQVARAGYAEAYARRGEYAQAQELLVAPGSPAHRLEACVGVAAIALAKGNPDAAKTAVEKGLLALKEYRKLSEWQLVQLVRVGSRVGVDGGKLKEVVDRLGPGFKERAQLEAFLGECARADGPVPVDRLAELRAALADKDGPALPLAWEHLARHAARHGRGADVEQGLQAADAAEKVRAQPLVHLGLALGDQDRRQ